MLAPPKLGRMARTIGRTWGFLVLLSHTLSCRVTVSVPALDQRATKGG